MPAAPLGHRSSEEKRRRTTAAPNRILVVDDEPGIRELLSQALGSENFDVTCAEDGLAAWGALCAGQFDLLITDHAMPGLSGLDLLRRVRTKRRDLPVIVISGVMPVGEEDFPQLISPGAAIEKPFTLVELLANVRRLLLLAPSRVKRAQ